MRVLCVVCCVLSRKARTVFYTPLIAPTNLEKLQLFLPYYLRWDSSAPQLPSVAYMSTPPPK